MEEKEIIRGGYSPTIYLIVAIMCFIIFLISFFAYIILFYYDEVSIEFGLILLPGLVLSGYYLLRYYATKKTNMVVTNKRVYGVVVNPILAKKIVDLPLDKISVVETESFTKKVSVSTNSGWINFYNLKNYMEIADVIKNLINNRQNVNINHEQADSKLSVIDELKGYKELLDIGALTQEEFDKKKNELLNK